MSRWKLSSCMIGLAVCLVGLSRAQDAAAPKTAEAKAAEEAVLALSKDKWQWMSERKSEELEALFHEQAVFVHMGGTMSRDQELEVIKSGSIPYKQAEIQESSVRIIDRSESDSFAGRRRGQRSHQPVHGDRSVRAAGR